MRISRKEVAAACGVSTQAVTCALNGSGRLSPETRTRIIETAQKMGYRRNSVADIMKSRRFGSVALLQSTDSSRGWIPQSLQDALHDELAQHDLHLMLVRLDDERIRSGETVPRLLREWACDGLLISYIKGMPPQLSEMIERYHLPAVWLNSKRESDAVFLDDEGDSYRNTQLLIEAGHQRIDYVPNIFGDTESPHYSESDRQQGYEKAMRAAGLEPRVLDFPQQQPYAQQPEFMANWLLRPDRPTAVLCYNESALLLAYSSALQVGLKIPRDLSLLSFNAPTLSLGHGISSLWFPSLEFAHVAVDMLLKKIEDPLRTFPSSPMPSIIFEGHSIAPPQKR